MRTTDRYSAESRERLLKKLNAAAGRVLPPQAPAEPGGSESLEKSESGLGDL